MDGRARQVQGLEVEELVQAHGEALKPSHRAHGEDDAGHEAGPVEGVGADGQLLTGVAQNDLLVGGQPAQAHGVDVHAFDDGAAGAVGVGIGGVG